MGSKAIVQGALRATATAKMTATTAAKMRATATASKTKLKSVSSDGNVPTSRSGGHVSSGFCKLGTREMKKATLNWQQRSNN